MTAAVASGAPAPARSGSAGRTRPRAGARAGGRSAGARSASEEAILRAALALVVDEGYQGTTMAAVARTSGLPIGSLYWHFTSKEALFAALIEYCFEAWCARHDADSNRELLFESIAVSAANSRTGEHLEEAFWGIGLLLALERRLEPNAARQTYLDVRRQMFARMVEAVEPQLPPAALARNPELARQVVTLGRAITDGIYISAAAGDPIDFVETAELAALAADGLIRHALDSDGGSA